MEPSPVQPGEELPEDEAATAAEPSIAEAAEEGDSGNGEPPKTGP